jgi:uncharacterized Zn finger protein
MADLVCPKCRSTAVRVLEVIAPDARAVRISCSECGQVSTVAYPPVPFRPEDEG